MSQFAESVSSNQRSSQQGRPSEDLETLKHAFAEDGYFIVRDVVSLERLSQLRTRILEEFEGAKQAGRLFSGGGLISGHLNCFPGEESRFAYDALQGHGIIDLIRSIFPKAVRLPNVGCNLNLPNSVAQHYHVDRNFTNDFIIANVAVVDTDLENGAIDLVPGTHKKFYKFWRFAIERPHRASKRVPMKQGDVLVRTSNVWHRGMPNRTAVARPMLAFTWEDGGSTRDDPFKVDDGKIVFRQNWYRPNFLGRLRERTFVTAPITYSAYRFVGSLFGTKGYDRP
jgi:hypothetical protein